MLQVIKTKGRRHMADGSIKEYYYNRKYYAKDPTEAETRGRPTKQNLKQLRDLIKNLSEENCNEVCNYIKKNFT